MILSIISKMTIDLFTTSYPDDFRLPLCMAVSWSYVRHLVHLFLRINCFPFALIWSFSFLRLFLFAHFFILCLFLALFFLIIFWNNSDGPKRILLLCFPYCQSNFIKLFDGGLQYKVIRTFTFRSVIFTSLDAFFKGIDGFDGLIKFGGILAGFIVETVASIMFRSCDFLYSVPRAIFKQVSESVKFK